MPFDVDLSQSDPLLARVRAVFSPAEANDILLYAGTRVGVKAEELVSPYPPASGKALAVFYVRQRADGTAYQSKFKSLAQQRKVMALVAQGKVPYHRTGTLGKSIVSQARVAGVGLVMVDVGSKLNYAPYVIDKFLQSHYHLGTWQPIQDDIQNGLPGLMTVAVNAVTHEANRRLERG